jgi:outer membrane protein OmpA-like peptidoglycan-associated protein
MRCHPLRRDTAGPRRRRAAAASWLLAATAGISTLAAACGGPSPQAKPVIIAATATANEPAPALSSADLQILQTAGTTSTNAAAYVIDPNSGQPAVISLTPRRTDGQVDYGPTRSQTLAANIDAVQRVLDHEAARVPFDLLSTIAAATRVTAPPATLILLSSGLSTAGGLDMRQVGWEASPTAIAAQLKTRGLLPNLAGYHVLFSGLAATSGRQPALPQPQRTTLTGYWLAICKAAGAASCTADEMTRPDPPSHSTTPVPMVPIPVVTSVHGPGGTTTTSLPDTLLFQFNSATLIPSASTALQPLATQARDDHQQVSITGYASPDGGTTAYNKALSQRRAAAVRNRLIALGLPAGQITKVTGAGTAGKQLDTCLVQGQLDEAICAQLRRVVVVSSPAPK